MELGFINWMCAAHFQNGEVIDDIYISLPKEREGQICKLKKALYGLKCSPKQFTNSVDFFTVSITLTQLIYVNLRKKNYIHS